jgi:hypothetical protein
MKNQLRLSISLAEIAKETAGEQATKKSTATTELVGISPAAIEKLRAKGGNLMSLTVKTR